MGNAKRNLQAFPKGAQKLIGDELQLIQFGGMPKDAKPFKGVGSGVLEIALRYVGDAYRTVLAVQLGERILSVAKLIDMKSAIPEQDRRGDQENSPRRA